MNWTQTADISAISCVGCVNTSGAKSSTKLHNTKNAHARNGIKSMQTLFRGDVKQNDLYNNICVCVFTIRKSSERSDFYRFSTTFCIRVRLFFFFFRMYSVLFLWLLLGSMFAIDTRVSIVRDQLQINTNCSAPVFYVMHISGCSIRKAAKDKWSEQQSQHCDIFIAHPLVGAKICCFSSKNSHFLLIFSPITVFQHHLRSTPQRWACARASNRIDYYDMCDCFIYHRSVAVESARIRKRKSRL